jgi:hypothetical protein
VSVFRKIITLIGGVGFFFATQYLFAMVVVFIHLFWAPLVIDNWEHFVFQGRVSYHVRLRHVLYQSYYLLLTDVVVFYETRMELFETLMVLLRRKNRVQEN